MREEGKKKKKKEKQKEKEKKQKKKKKKKKKKRRGLRYRVLGPVEALALRREAVIAVTTLQ